VALVGESGCGKSVTALSLSRLVPEPPGRYVDGQVLLQGRDILKMNRRKLKAVRGRGLAYIFQEPAAALNPVFSVGNQILEALKLHQPEKARKSEVCSLLQQVGIANAAQRFKAFPHQLSGGQQQRVVLAMALACRPQLLVADEPTTALDVTVQAQVLSLLSDLRKKYGMALLLITHNLGLLPGTAERMYVMYAGRIIERGPVSAVLSNPRHPYTAALLRAIPRMEGEDTLQGISGAVPSAAYWPEGCRFHPRCPHAAEPCRQDMPPEEEVETGWYTACWRWKEI
jgi:peptide/nickel transport system ATP-binding protein/oligopeptide transport system ATP-binding protein